MNRVSSLRKESFYFALGFGTGGLGKFGEGVKRGEGNRPGVEAEMGKGSR